MLYLIYAFIGISLILVVNFFSSVTRHRDTISIMKRRREKFSLGQLVIRVLKPLNLVNIPLLKIFPFLKKGLDEKLSFVNWNMSEADFVGIKEIIGAVAAFLFILIDPKDFIFAPLIFVLASFVPDIMLKKQMKNKKEDIVRVLPETVDLLSLCVSAGLDFMASVKWITAKARDNPMIDELKKVLEATKIGRPKVEALREMSARLDIPEVTSFTRNLIQAERMGTPVEESFKIISDDVRTRRSFRGRKEAQKTAMKMLIPLIIFILPIIMIIVAGPVLLQFMKGGLGGVVPQ
jgi:tight adherence protein C